jgi:histidinol-phosphatase
VQAWEWVRFLEELADRTDPIALRWFRSATLAVELKADASPVTEADRAIEEAARELLARRHPTLGVLGEELGGPEAGGERLIIDPIDATRNFVRGIPVFATLLALEIDGEVVAGVVSAPALHTRWKAGRGVGAWEGERRLRVSGVEELSEAQLFHGSLGGEERPARLDGLLHLATRARRTRGFGDFYQHCLVASGAGEIALDFGLKPWDVAALQVLVEEAGGRLTGLGGERSLHAGNFATTNGRLHRQVLAVLAEYGG